MGSFGVAVVRRKEGEKEKWIIQMIKIDIFVGVL